MQLGVAPNGTENKETRLWHQDHFSTMVAQPNGLTCSLLLASTTALRPPSPLCPSTSTLMLLGVSKSRTHSTSIFVSWPLGKKHSDPLSGPVFINRDALLIQSYQRTLIHSVLKQPPTQLQAFSLGFLVRR